MTRLVPATTPRVQSREDFEGDLRRVAAAQSSTPAEARHTWIAEKDEEPSLVWTAPTTAPSTSAHHSPRKSDWEANTVCPRPRTFLPVEPEPSASTAVAGAARALDAIVLISDDDDGDVDVASSTQPVRTATRKRSRSINGVSPSLTPPAKSTRRDRGPTTAQPSNPRTVAAKTAAASASPSPARDGNGASAVACSPAARSSTSSSVQILSQAAPKSGKLPGQQRRAGSQGAARQTSIEDFLRPTSH